MKAKLSMHFLTLIFDQTIRVKNHEFILISRHLNKCTVNSYQEIGIMHLEYE